MKKWNILSGVVLLTVVSAGCSSAYRSSAGYAVDDLYVTHDKTEIARRQQQEAEARKAEADARRAEWEARIAEAQAAAAENAYNGTLASDSYSYSSVLADTYESAYARRLRGFESLSYRMPSSYYNFRYGDAFTYVSAYDPAFYNIVVSGDQVWVEPKYISSMFGTWGATVYTGGWHAGWGFGPSWWGYPAFGWNWGFAYHPWHDPWYRPGWRPGWGPGWHGHWGYRPPHNYRLDSYSRPNNSGWRPNNTGGSRSDGYGRGYNSGRRGSYNNNGRGGSYNNRGTNNRNSGYNNGTRNDSNNSFSRPANNTDRNNGFNNNNGFNSGRGNSYNSGRGNSGGFGGSSGGYSGGSSSGGSRGGGSYNSGR